MKKTVNKILSVLLSAALLLTLLPAFAAAGPRDITEVFSAELFSDAAVNEFLKVFPQFAGGIESTLYSTPSDSPAYVELDPNGFSFSGDLYVKINGDCDTATFAEFFRAYDVNIYPQTLGAYLEDNGYGEIAAALLAAGEWADFDTGDGPAFDFDWGLDGIDDLAQRYEAFIGVIGTLIGAAKPMFALALGTQDLTLNFPGEMQFFKIVSPLIHMQYGTGFTAINKDLTDVVFYDITGSAVFPALGLYQAFVLPLYGALGVGTAIDYTFAAWNNTAEADALAALLFDPLYALVSAVQNDPAARETLISFYGEGCEERVAQIGAGCTQKDGEISVSDAEVDFQVTGGLIYVQSAVKEALLFLFCEFGNSSFSIDASAFADVEGYRDRLNALLPALTDPAACEHIPGPSVMEIVTEPTCCDIGWIDDVIYCELCGEELQRTRLALDRLPHSFYTVPEVPATCTSEGTSEYTVCEYCAVYGVAPEVIPALGHDWGEWETVIPATAETEGLEQRVCCRNASHIETRAIPMLPETPPVVASGVCGGVGDGTNVSWTLTSDGTLTISGTGPMNANEYQWPMPWAAYKDSILAVQIGEGVETISANAFLTCSALTSVSIPEGMTHIGACAFYYCENLAELVLPDSLTQIDNYAFCGCSSLTDVTLPAGLTRIETGSFTSCTGLSNVVIPEGVTYIGDWAFCNCAMTEIALPSTLEELGDYAFYESKLETVTIPDGITAIGEGVFGNSDDLQTVYLPQSIEQLGYHAFCYCCRLDHVYYDGLRTDWEQVEIDDECFEHAPVVHFTDGTHLCAPGSPVSVTVQQSTCGGPGSYEEVYYCRECGEEMYREQKEIQAERHLWGDWTVLTPPTATEEGLMERHCIRDESHTETALIPAGEFGEHELLRGYCGGEGDGKNLIWTLTDDNVITISGEGPMADYGDYYIAVNHITNYSSESYRRGPDVPWPGEGNDPIQRWFALQGYYNDSDIMDLIVNGGIDWDALTDAIFSEDQPAYTVVVEPGVTYVGANAFAGTNVTALSLPSTAEEIGYGAFYGLNCKDLVLPEGVRWVGANAFSSGNYENLTLPASLEGLGGGAFQLDPGYDGHACTLTVLCPDERVSGILSGITVRGMRTEMAGIGSIEDYRDAILVRYLAEAYYVIQHFDALVEEEITYFEEDLGTALTPQQRENVGEYYLWAYTYELRNFGVNLELGEQSAATVCNEINRILGTSFAPEELFEIHETENGTFDVDIRLSPAASTRFTERFGIAYDEVNTGWYYSSLNWLKENEETVIAPYLTLRGHCGSALESEYADTVPFEAVEHDPANGEVILEPTCTTPGQRSVTCPVCGETFTEEIPAPGGHCYQISVTTAPTCTENGEVTYTCLICGDTYTETLAALGHGTRGYDVSGAPSTCIVRGYSLTICIACGEITDYQEFPLDPTNHNWGEWTVVTPATYLTEGLEQRACGWCGDTETRPIPALVPDEVISDPDTGIELQLQQGVLPENTVFTVDEEFDGTYFRLLNREVGNLSSTLYNITPVADGVNVQPDGWVLVRLPIPAGYNPDSLSIYYISTETGVTERMDCYVEDGYICFQTTHFSVYAIVDASAPAEAPTETPTNNGGGTSLSFFARISAFFQRIADFFKNLFRR